MTATDPQLAAMPAERLAPAAEALAAALAGTWAQRRRRRTTGARKPPPVVLAEAQRLPRPALAEAGDPEPGESGDLMQSCPGRARPRLALRASGATVSACTGGTICPDGSWNMHHTHEEHDKT